MISYLTAKDILKLHFNVVEDYGGTHGVRDEGRIESLVAAPAQTVFGAEQYSDVYLKAAVYMRNVIADHPFVDGNKRTGITITGVFLIRNGIRLCASSLELEDFAVRVAVEHLEIAAIAEWLQEHSSGQ
jgi:death-on-curing protein